MHRHDQTTAAWLIIILGVLLAVGVGALSRPLAKPAPLRNPDRSIVRNADGSTAYDPASVKSVAVMLRPYDMAGFAGITLSICGVLLLLRTKRKLRTKQS